MKKKVLIIDDDLNICRDIKYALQDDSTTDVYCTLSVAEALEVFMKPRFCLVIMDVLLAETDGRKLLKIMRQAKTIPILVLSSKASSAERTSLLKTGVNVYLEKPYDLGECLAQAQSLMQLYTDANPVESRCYTLAFGMELIIDPSHVWNSNSEINLEATIKSHIRSLRQKMSPRGKNYIKVCAVWGIASIQRISDDDDSEEKENNL